MSKIKIKVIKPETIEVFSPEGTSYGNLNELEFLDLRCQIKKNKLDGFYIYYKGDKILIDNNGFLHKYVPLFQDSIHQYNYILGIEDKIYEEHF